MEEVCPLCIKQGFKHEIKAFQINLEEAVWMCESEECIWPMTYKELEFIPRKIGESGFYNTPKPNRTPVRESQSGWQSFDTPPYTPKTEVSPAASSDASSHSSYGVNSLHSVYSKEPISLPPSKETKSYSTNDERMNALENSINTSLLSQKNEEVLMDITNPSVSNQFSLERLHSTIVSEISDAETSVSDSQENLSNPNVTPNLKTLQTKVPTILSIEKTNLVNVRVKSTNQKLSQKEHISKSTNSKTCVQKISSPPNSTLEIKTENLQSNNYIKVEEVAMNPSSVEVRTVEIEGLPPVTLTFEVPSFLQEAEKCKGEVHVEANLEINKKNVVEKTVQTLSKESIMASKKFEKFSFSELKKAKNLQKNGDDKSQISNNGVKCSETNEIVIEKKETILVPETKISEPVFEVDKSISIDQNLPSDIAESVTDFSQNTGNLESVNPSNIEIDVPQNYRTSESNPTNIDINLNPDSDDSKDNVISDLDSFLNEFMEENNVNMNESLSPVDDDWLLSLHF